MPYTLCGCYLYIQSLSALGYLLANNQLLNVQDSPVLAITNMFCTVLDAICIYTQLNNCLAMKLNIAKARNRSGVPHHVIKEVAGWRLRFGFPTLLRYVSYSGTTSAPLSIECVVVCHSGDPSFAPTGLLLMHTVSKHDLTLYNCMPIQA